MKRFISLVSAAMLTLQLVLLAFPASYVHAEADPVRPVSPVRTTADRAGRNDMARARSEPRQPTANNDMVSTQPERPINSDLSERHELAREAIRSRESRRPTQVRRVAAASTSTQTPTSAPSTTPMPEPTENAATARAVKLASNKRVQDSWAGKGSGGEVASADETAKPTQTTEQLKAEDQTEAASASTEEKAEAKPSSPTSNWYWWLVGFTTLAILYYLLGGRSSQPTS